MIRWLLLLLLNLIFFAPSVPQWLSRKQDPVQCLTPENFSGVCVPLSYCPQITDLFTMTEEIIAVQYLIAAHQNCGAYNVRGDLVVCCMLQAHLELSQESKVPADPTLGSLQLPFVNFDQSNPFLPKVPVATDDRLSLETTTQKSQNPFLPASTTMKIKTTSTTSPSTSPPHKPHNPFLPHTTKLEEHTTKTLVTTTPPVTTNQPAIVQKSQKSCEGPYPYPGVCINIKECPDLRDELKRIPDNRDFKNYLRNLNDICGNIGYDVCCEVKTSEDVLIKNSDDTPRELPTPEDGCGYSAKGYFNKIVGGEPSAIGAWPWVALLGYQTPSGLKFLCGGTLITARHVLTAAHCIRRDLVLARLGEHDLSRDDETAHIDYTISKSERHPKYNSRNGRADLAILYLEKNVQFSDTISPICLPLTSELRTKSYKNHFPFAVGWGKTMEDGKSSNVLLQIQVPIHGNELCRKTYEENNRLLSEDQFDEAIVCAGVLSGGKDTCQGDSGGPLMMPEDYNKSVRFYLIGAVSYGIGCARPGVPSVYASTQYFLDWIIEKVADTQHKFFI